MQHRITTFLAALLIATTLGIVAWSSPAAACTGAALSGPVASSDNRVRYFGGGTGCGTNDAWTLQLYQSGGLVHSKTSTGWITAEKYCRYSSVGYTFIAKAFDNGRQIAATNPVILKRNCK